MKKIAITIALVLGVLSIHSQVLINEFEPSPLGTDPPNQNVELKGTPSTAFSGVIISVEGDNVSTAGQVERISNVSGTFDTNGLLVVSIADLENPSFTIVLLSSFSGSIGDTVDVSAIMPNVLDAIGVPDNNGDTPNLIADDLGGTNIIAGSSTEPRILFRDGNDNAIYSVVTTGSGNTTIYDASGDAVPASNFSGDPTVTSLGIENESNNGSPVLSVNELDKELIELAVFPNPVTSGDVRIEGLKKDNIDATVHSLLGEKVLSRTTNNGSLDISSLQSGVYLLSVFQDKKLETLKLVVE